MLVLNAWSLELRAYDFRIMPNWQKYPLRCYKQLWTQLQLSQDVLCRLTKSPTMLKEQMLIVVYSL